MDESKNITFSFIVPLYNEQDGLELFYDRLVATAEALNEPFEIIFVNDGSQDETAVILRRLCELDFRVRVVDFSRNFGHQIAVTAGYDFACGRAVISLDGDCQHPPEVIPELVARWREGFEVVYTVRRDTKGISRIRRGTGRIMYRFIRWSSGADLTDQADFRLLDHKVVEALRRTREHARLIRGLVRWLGFRQTSVSYVAQQRTHGKSSYSLKQLAGMSGAGFFNFSLRPLRIVPKVGGVLLTAAIVYAAASLALWPLGKTASPIVHLIMAIVGLFGLQFVFLGLIGEYVGRIFEEAKARPLYVVRETVGFPAETQEEAESGVSPARSEDNPVTIYT